MRVGETSIGAVDLGFKDKAIRAAQIPWRRWLWYLAAAAAIFLLGFAPMAWKEWNTADQRDTARRELRLSTLQNSLASAVIDAQRAEYEPARQTASDFFTDLRARLDQDAGSDLNAKQRDLLRPLLDRRDEIITLLARSDPAAVRKLSDLYVEFRKAMSTVEPVRP